MPPGRCADAPRGTEKTPACVEPGRRRVLLRYRENVRTRANTRPACRAACPAFDRRPVRLSRKSCGRKYSGMESHASTRAPVEPRGRAAVNSSAARPPDRSRVRGEPAAGSPSSAASSSGSEGPRWRTSPTTPITVTSVCPNRNARPAPPGSTARCSADDSEVRGSGRGSDQLQHHAAAVAHHVQLTLGIDREGTDVAGLPGAPEVLSVIEEIRCGSFTG